MATYPRALSVQFGHTYTGLSGSVGYTVSAQDGTTLIARTTGGIVESPSGSGIYHAQAVFTDTWVGHVYYDITGHSEAQAIETFEADPASSLLDGTGVWTTNTEVVADSPGSFGLVILSASSVPTQSSTVQGLLTAAAQPQLTIVRGTNTALLIAVVDQSGVAVPIPSVNLIWGVKRYPGLVPDKQATLFYRQSNGGIAVTNANAGTAQVNVLAVDTQYLPPATGLTWSLKDLTTEVELARGLLDILASAVDTLT